MTIPLVTRTPTDIDGQYEPIGPGFAQNDDSRTLLWDEEAPTYAKAVGLQILLVAMQITAVATAGLALFAAVPAVFAFLAFRKQSAEVGLLQQQADTFVSEGRVPSHHRGGTRS